jgi:hypothetical protein
VASPLAKGLAGGRCPAGGKDALSAIMSAWRPAGDPSHAIHSKHLKRTLDEPFALFVPG